MNFCFNRVSRVNVSDINSIEPMNKNLRAQKNNEKNANIFDDALLARFATIKRWKHK